MRRSLAVVLWAIGGCTPDPGDVTPLQPPAQSMTLPLPAMLDPGVYLSTAGHAGYQCDPDDGDLERKCPLDINAVRWDGDGYSRVRPDTPGEVMDDLMFGLPLYAPVAGEVIACWRGMPDDFVDGDDVNCPGGDRRCIQGGNHLNILTDDGLLLFVGHLQQDTIPAQVCPIDDRFLYATDPKRCALGDGWEGLRESSRLDRRGLAGIRVEPGQLLGRVGTSGSSTGPHLHIHAKPYAFDGDDHCEAHSVALAWTDTQTQVRLPDRPPDDDAWIDLEGEVLPIDGRAFVLRGN